jgi:hypothetical protein
MTMLLQSSGERRDFELACSYTVVNGVVIGLKRSVGLPLTASCLGSPFGGASRT